MIFQPVCKFRQIEKYKKIMENMKKIRVFQVEIIIVDNAEKQLCNGIKEIKFNIALKKLYKRGVWPRFIQNL